MLDFRHKVQEIIENWNKDFPDNQITPVVGRDGAEIDFAGYAASALRDAAENQFSDGFDWSHVK